MHHPLTSREIKEENIDWYLTDGGGDINWFIKRMSVRKKFLKLVFKKFFRILIEEFGVNQIKKFSKKKLLEKCPFIC